MKKASLLLLIFVSLCAFTCENEVLDADIDQSATINTGGSSASLIGTWRAVSLDADIQTATTLLGFSTTVDSDVVGTDLDYTLTFTEDTYTATGSYVISMTTSFNGESPMTTTQGGDVTTESGTYENVGPTTMILDEPFYTFSVPGADTSGVTGEPQELEYSISADGQTLTFVQNQQDVQSLEGIEISVSVMSTSVFTRE
ncbi:hypothetical protein KORDIASMS9_04296 [Kordia sp. SMS9]|uniref:hypothetical protein n=1 Tax=Kordia sp. SMS9 TaxID=2282170 RepID=UPI000E0CEE89|nr:hypothetical protein [Kordia sp. SMS9]AXG72034.1 hypothetical protein KORDIASMS9_04296 [Kordia sp. SMS9]